MYWVQLPRGDRDHLDDAHPRASTSSALRPRSRTHEGGDAPGGVLETRAWPSSMHPVPPSAAASPLISSGASFIFEHKLFKAGYDRVVDTEDPPEEVAR